MKILIWLLFICNLILVFFLNKELNKKPLVEKEYIIKEIPVDKIIIKEVEIIKEIPIEKIIVKKEIKEVPVKKIVYKTVIKEVEKIKYQCDIPDYSKLKVSALSGYGRAGNTIEDFGTSVSVSPKNGWINGLGVEYSPENSDFYYGVNATTNGNYLLQISYEFDIFK